MPWFGFPSIARIRDIIPFIVRVISKTLPETITVGEVLERLSFAFRSTVETVTLTDEPTATRIKVRNLSEQVNLSTGGYTPEGYTETGFTVTYDVTRQTIKARTVPTETVTLSDSVDRSKIVVVDGGPSGEVITLSDAVAFVLTKGQLLTETVTISDALARVTAKARANAETVAVSDSLATVLIKSRPITETVTLSDAVAAQKINGRLITETVTLSDEVTATRIRPRTNPETVTISDQVAAVRILNRSLTETVTLTDLAERTRIKVRSPPAETVTLSDDLARATVKTRNPQETVSISDSLTRLTSKFRAILALPETVHLIEAIQRATVKARSLSETVSLTDAVRIGARITKSLVETVTLSDEVTRLIVGPGQWILTGKVTDFTDRLDNMVKTYIAAEWAGTVTPQIGTTLSSQLSQNNFNYDSFRTYYIKITEGKSRVVNRQLRQRLYQFETPIELEVSVRRLSKGEAFSEMNDILNELMRIFGQYADDDIFGVRGITPESITPLGNDSANKSIWQRVLTINLHYFKTDNSAL